jgi:hypothetical protein
MFYKGEWLDLTGTRSLMTIEQKLLRKHLELMHLYFGF